MARRSLIVARRVLAVATTPLLPVFNDHLVRADDSFAESVMHRLEKTLDGRAPSLWTLTLEKEWATIFAEAEKEGVDLKLEHLVHNTRLPGAEPLPCVCLIQERGSSRHFLPSSNDSIKQGDTLLFAGRGSARREMLFALQEPTAILSYATGRQLPRGALMRYFSRRRNA